MILLLQRLFDICRLRASPQDLPHSPFLRNLALTSYAGAGLLLAMTHTSFAQACAMVLVDILLLISLTYLLLWLTLKSNRFTQTLTSLTACGALLALIAWPLLLWQSGADPPSQLAGILLWFWFIWQIIVFSHIIRQALTTVMPIAVALVLLYMFISINIAQILFYQNVG